MRSMVHTLCNKSEEYQEKESGEEIIITSSEQAQLIDALSANAYNYMHPGLANVEEGGKQFGNLRDIVILLKKIINLNNSDEKLWSTPDSIVLEIIALRVSVEGETPPYNQFVEGLLTSCDEDGLELQTSDEESTTVRYSDIVTARIL